MIKKPPKKTKQLNWCLEVITIVKVGKNVFCFCKFDDCIVYNFLDSWHTNNNDLFRLGICIWPVVCRFTENWAGKIDLLERTACSSKLVKDETKEAG